MSRSSGKQSRASRRGQSSKSVKTRRSSRHSQRARPAAAYRRRGSNGNESEPFNAPEIWHEPTGRDDIRFFVQPAGVGYIHPVTPDEVNGRIAELPAQYRHGIEVVQFSRMTRKRALFPCYGMQWGPNIYLYPIEESLVETFVRPPQPAQVVEARMFGGKWSQDGPLWRLEWTAATIRDFYLNNVLIHEIGHIHDDRNTSFDTRERFADWFAIEYGYRASRV
jgi:hypothetical protein